MPVEGPIGHPLSHCTRQSFEVGAQLTNDIAGIFSLPDAWRISAKNAVNLLAIAFCGGASVSGGLASHDNRTTQAASFLGPQGPSIGIQLVYLTCFFFLHNFPPFQSHSLLLARVYFALFSACPTPPQGWTLMG